MAMDKAMLELLQICDCIELVKYFSSVTKRSLISCSLRQMKSKVKRLLPSTSEGLEAGKKIVAALIDAASDDEGEEETLIKQEIKEEEHDEDGEEYQGSATNYDSGHQEPDEPPPDDDDEITFLEEVTGDVSVLAVDVKKEKDTVIIEDEDDEEGDDETATAGNEESNISPVLRAKKRRADIMKKVDIMDVGIVPLTPMPSCIEKMLMNPRQHVVLNEKSVSRGVSLSRWKSLFLNYGDRITTLDLLHWKWGDPATSPLPLNLYLVLSHTPNLEKLNVYQASSDCSDFTSTRLKLPELKFLKIRHEREMNYHFALRQIILAGIHLEEIQLEYNDEFPLRNFFSMLNGMEEKHLKSIKSLSIKEILNESVALVREELDLLAGTKLKNLEELFLGFCLWDDTDSVLKRLLSNFTKLKRLTIQGCFITTAKNEPNIVVDFPAMPQLELLNMGKSYKFSSTFETIKERPAKRRKSSMRIRNEEDEQIGENLPVPTEGQEDYTVGEFFTVTLNLPALPQLKTLSLGALYDLQDLHFGRFPSLKVFRVSSPWHLTVKFPSTDSRHRTYPNVTGLQFPDGLTDHTFVAKVATHFPSIERCWIYLPTVKVLRAFSKQMVERNELKLEELDMKVQFDFASSLDWVFLEKPSVECVGQSAQELEKIRILNSYEHWEEYVKVHHVDVPNAEELPAIENEAEFRGLSALCLKLQETLDLKIHHIPRTLRVPAGNKHWTEDDCQFSNTLIGFKDMEYPFSAEAWEFAPLKMIVKHFRLPPKAFRVEIPHENAFFEVDTSTNTTAVGKKDEPEVSVNPR